VVYAGFATVILLDMWRSVNCCAMLCSSWASKYHKLLHLAWRGARPASASYLCWMDSK